MQLKLILEFLVEFENQQNFQRKCVKSVFFLVTIPTYLPVSIMHICTGCLTGENPPNSAVLSCHLCLFYCLAKSQVTEIPLDDVYPLCPRSPTPCLPWDGFHRCSLFGIRLLSIRSRWSNHFSLRFLIKLVSWGCLVTDLMCLLVTC